MPLQTSVKLVPTAKDLRVKLTVLNNSNQYEIFGQMSCSWEGSWRCDKSGVALMPHECAKNTPHTIILPPGHSYHEEEWPLLIRNARPGKMTFRFGLVRTRSDFTSREIERIYHSAARHYYFSSADIAPRYKREKDVFWSSPVAAVIRKEWIAG